MIAICPLCEGKGFKTISTNRGVRRVAPCDCQKTARTAALTSKADFPRQYDHCTLDNFDVKFRSSTQSLTRALLTARKFVEHYPIEKEGMLFWGGCGTGKTHLAIAILKELIQGKSVSCLFRGYSALLKQIQGTYSRQDIGDENAGPGLTEYSILRDVTEAEVLVLDDLGAERSTEWALSMLYHVINERYNARLTTIITTNLPWADPEGGPPVEKMSKEQRATRPETLRDRISERTYSRITEMCPVRIELIGTDYRKIRGARIQ